MDKKQDKSPTVTLKRNVTIKAVVTDQFKKFLTFELNQAITGLNERQKQLDDILAKNEGTSEYRNQLSHEKQQNAVNKEDLTNKINVAQKLQNDTLFVQGVVEGFATVKKGDNLYEKLGAMEIIVKDGLVNELNMVEKYNQTGAQTPASHN
jgi:hypothetical protein